MFAKSFVLALLAASANAVSLETERIYDGCGCQLPSYATVSANNGNNCYNNDLARDRAAYAAARGT